MPTSNIPLPRLNAYLAAVCHDDQRLPGYMRLWQRASSGELPHMHYEFGRWTFDEADVPKIAAALGLKLKEGVKVPRRTKAVANGSA